MKAEAKTQTGATLRKLLMAVLRRDAQLQEFCLDHFPEVASRFGDNMDRLVKLNLLLELVPHEEISNALRLSYPESLARVDTLSGKAGTHEPVRNLHLDARSRRNRQKMIEKVRRFWVEGVMQKSLHRAIHLKLGKEYRPDAVTSSRSGLASPLATPASNKISAGTEMVELFDEQSGELLILGAPGSGKTTLLLELCSDLLLRAESDETYPIAVVFNLSSWAQERLPLGNWLVEELQRRYEVPVAVATEWLLDSQIIPLLDGLDEVPLEWRALCIEAINRFHQGQASPGLVVSCRITAYTGVRKKLRLAGAIEVLPISLKQVEAILGQQPIAPAVDQLYSDHSLLGLLRLPFFLTVLFHIYSTSKQTTADPRILSVKELRTAILQQYVITMLRAHNAKFPWKPEQILNYLKTISQHMRNQLVNVFTVNDIQPQWLSGPISMHVYRLISWLLGAVCSGLMFSSLAWMIFDIEIEHTMIYGAIYGPATGIVLSSVFLSRRIENVITLRWRWRGVGRYGAVLFFSLLVQTELFLRLFDLNSIASRSVRGIAILVGILIALWSDGLVRDEVEDIDYQSKATLLSAKNALTAAVVSGTIFGLLMGIALLRQHRLFMEISFFCGVCTGLFVAANFGGFPIVSHLALRLLLIFAKSVPLRLVFFLNCAVEQNLLYRVGGGYMFIHRLLRDYFNYLTEDDIRELAEAICTPQRNTKAQIAA